MATTGNVAGSVLFSPQMLQLLQNAIGGTVDQNINKTGSGTVDTTQQTNQATSQTGAQNSTTTGTQNSNQTGNNSTVSTGGTTGTNQSTVQSTADVAALKQVFNQQQSGISPEMLAAIFTEGSKAAPGLITATANAVGARSANNTPLATALSNLSAQLTSKAAELSLGQRDASAKTAEAIARATGGSITTGAQNQQTTSTQTGTNSSNTTGTNTSATAGTSSQNGTQTGTTGTTQKSSNNESTSNQTDTQPNYGNVTKLLGMLLGGSALNSGLSGIGGISGAIGAGQDGIANLIRQLIGGGGGGELMIDPNGSGIQDNPGGLANLDLLRDFNRGVGAGDTGDRSSIGGTPGFYGNLGSDNDLFSSWLSSLGQGSLGTDLGLAGVDISPPNMPDWWKSEGWDNFNWDNVVNPDPDPDQGP